MKNIFKTKTLVTILTLAAMLILASVHFLADSAGAFNFLSTYNLVLTIVLAIITITLIALLFVNIAKLSAAADNEYGRKMAREGILTCLICLGLVGSVDTIYAMLMSLIFSMG